MNREKWNIVAAMFVAFFVVVANIILVPPLLPFIVRELPMSERMAATMLAAFPLMAFVINLLVGPFIDWHGRRRMIVLGSVGSGLCLALSAAAESAAWVATLRALTGFFMPMVGASVFAVVADHAAGDDRVRAMGYVASAGAVAQLAIPPLGILVSERWSWRLVFAALAVCCFAVAASSMVLLRKTAARHTDSITPQTYRQVFRAFSTRPPLVSAVAGYVVAVMAVLTIQAIYPTWLLGGGQTGSVAALFLAAGIGGAIGASQAGVVTRRLADRDSTIALLLMAGVPCAIAIALLPRDLQFLFVPYVGFAILYSMLVPVVRAAANDLVSETERGTLNGLLNAAYQLGAALGAALGVILFAADSTFFTNGFVAALLLIGAAMAFWLRRLPNS
jgi:MFS transporter, DHA1 family, multidrug resistance protein